MTAQPRVDDLMAHDAVSVPQTQSRLGMLWSKSGPAFAQGTTGATQPDASNAPTSVDLPRERHQLGAEPLKRQPPKRDESATRWAETMSVSADIAIERQPPNERLLYGP